jgi:PAS domain S-box-containing protein
LSADDVVGILDRLTDGIVVLGDDWRYRYLNEPAAAMLGRTREELLGRRIWTEFPDGVGQPFHLAYERAFREGRPVRIAAYHSPSGRWLENRVYPHDGEIVIVFRDITELEAVERELQENADRMSEAERIAGFGVWRWEIESGQVRWSEELHRIYGLRPGEFEGTVDAFLAHVRVEDRERVWKNVSRAVAAIEPFVFEERIRRADGAERVLLSQGRAIPGPDGRAAAVVGICHDVTDRAEAERALGVSEQRMRAIIDNTPSVVSVKDLSGRYTMVNAETARLLGLRPDELVGHRWVEVFPPGVAEKQLANDRMAAAEGQPVYDETVLLRDGEERTFVTVTFALPDDLGRPVETCTIGTDVTERRERETQRRQRLDWQVRIRSALHENRMAMFAQPVVDLATGDSDSYELLVRMVRADKSGPVMEPAAFLPAAERFGLVQEIDIWMVGQALRVADRVKPEVNLSAVTLCDPAAREQIVGLLRMAPGLARRIVFEITETATIEHLEAAESFASDLTALGCGLALDDFGTGFGSFTYLRRLPLRYLKIDRSFVRNLPRSASDRRVVQSVVGIADRFGLQTIAQGVEDEGTLDMVRQLGADYAQGFHLGRPGPL